MSNSILVQFVGFEVKPMVREYTFTVRESASEPREFTLSISNEAFNGRLVRYQDAPDVCSVKLRRELATHANHPPITHYSVTDADLEEYRSTHSPRTGKTQFGRKAQQSF
ncbi:MAG TPA: hypothetical protein VMH00_16940 [Candidatus Limnocylindrales bacterium]|nr:hypothetical protein [Candidatus Limnocylindrales bacterium]